MRAFVLNTKSAAWLPISSENGLIGTNATHMHGLSIALRVSLTRDHVDLVCVPGFYS